MITPTQLAPGLVVNAGVRMAREGTRDVLTPFALDVRAEVPRSGPNAIEVLTVVGAIREYRGQAQVMLDVLALHGEAYFRQLYTPKGGTTSPAADALLPLTPRNVERWTLVVASLYQRGILSMKGHVGGLALDWRTVGLTDAQVETLSLACIKCGARKILHEKPPLGLHVEISPPK